MQETIEEVLEYLTVNNYPINFFVLNYLGKDAEMFKQYMVWAFTRGGYCKESFIGKFTIALYISPLLVFKPDFDLNFNAMEFLEDRTTLQNEIINARY